MADGIEVVSSETEARHQELLAKVMEDCGSFISIWAASGLAMNRHTILASYKTVAEWIVTDTWDSSSRPDIERLLPIVASDILYSTYRNDLTRLQLQLERLPRNISTDIIRTAMFIASAQGCIDVAEALFSRGVDIDSRDSKGQTCLHIAAIHNHLSMVSFLINHNADVNKRRNDGQTVWTLVCVLASHEEISHLLIRSGADKHVLVNGVNSLYVAAAGGHARDVELLLRQGVNPSIKTVFLWEPLVSHLQDILESYHGGILTTGVMQHWAASNGFLEVVRLLVEAGANVNCVSDTGATPLKLVGNRWPDIKEYLENHGAQVTPSRQRRPRGSRSSRKLVRARTGASIHNSSLPSRLPSVPIQETNSGSHSSSSINTQMTDNASAPIIGNSANFESAPSATFDHSQDPLSSFWVPLESVGSLPTNAFSALVDSARSLHPRPRTGFQ